MTVETAVTSVHKAFLGFSQRAEKASNEMLVDTFVDTAPLLDSLLNKNGQILYGRRGTGKTHALKYIADLVRTKGDVPVYIDLRSVGSNSSIYNDNSRALPDRATHLLNDLLQAVLSSLYPIAVECIDKISHPNQVTIRLDDFQNAISSVRVVGNVERERGQVTANASKLAQGVSLAASAQATAAMSSFLEEETNSTISTKGKDYGIEVMHVDFGNVQTALAGLLEVLGIKNLWILVDEWSEVPIDLQPYLADLIRRTILPIQTCIVKIAAIEHRSQFTIRRDRGEYIGFELGADIAANLNLDDFLVFEADEQRSVQFFKNLVFKHYINSEQADKSINSADLLVQTAFTQQNVFAEFVRAVEGVPRDALNLAMTMATKAYGNKITMQHVRESARDWYQRDKASVMPGKGPLANVLTIIINEVIDNRKARAFLFPSNTKNTYIEELFDARLLHVLKKNISSKDEPGARYDVFKIDYGCYVQLINTNEEPKGLFGYDADAEDVPKDASTIDVPKDDYRSIRRAILRPELLAKLEAEDTSQKKTAQKTAAG